MEAPKTPMVYIIFTLAGTANIRPHMLFFLNKMVAFTHGMVAIAFATGSRNSTCCRGGRGGQTVWGAFCVFHD